VKKSGQDQLLDLAGRLAASLILILSMSKHFRPWKIDQVQLLPPSVQDFVPQDHLARFIVALVRESLDLSAITAGYGAAWANRRSIRG